MDAAVGLPEGLNGIDCRPATRKSGRPMPMTRRRVCSGSLSGLFSVGADEPLTISLSTTTSGLPTLLSQGEEVTYSVTDGASSDTLTATAGGRTVFTLVVNADGSWTFDLDDQLDHVDDGTNTENFAAAALAGRRGRLRDRLLVDRCGDRRGRRRGPWCGERELHDRGSGRHPGSGYAPTPVAATVDEDGWTPRWRLPEGDQRHRSVDRQQGSRGDNADDEASGVLGSLSGLFSVGADEPLTISLSRRRAVCRRCSRRARRSPTRATRRG